MRLTVLYPFMEDSFDEQYTLSFIDTLVQLQKTHAFDMLITVDKSGRTSEALKKARLSYDEVPFNSPVGIRDFYFVTLFKLVRSALPSFFYFKEHTINVVHCPDVLSLLCWGNTAKMNRVFFITSLHKKEKASHYTSLMLTDSKKLICASEELRSSLPARFSSTALLAPEAQNLPENEKEETARKNAVDFWIQLYASLFIKPDLSKITGILNKN